MSLLTQRYPSLCSEQALDSVTTLLFTPGAVEAFNDTQIEDKLKNILNNGGDNTEDLTEDERARLLCLITTKLLTTLNTTHCTPLPANKFTLPWSQSDQRKGDFVKL